MVVGLVLSVVLASPSSGYVVLSKRSGVATPRALEVAAAVQQRLVAGGVPLSEVEDATSCKGKKVCLVALGRQKHALSMVLVEVGAVLDDAIARVELISVEEDGRSLAVVKHEGPLRTLSEDVGGKVSAMLLQPLRQLHGIKDAEPLVEPPVVKADPLPPPPPQPPQQTEPEKQVEKPVEHPVEKPVEQPVAVEATPAATTSFSGARIAALAIAGVGVGTLVGALVQGVRSGGYGKLRDGTCAGADPCTDRYGVAYANASAQTAQTAVILSVTGAALVVVGATVFLIDLAAAKPTSTPVVAIVPVPGGAVLGLAAHF
jgi:hypothetical protein